MTDSLPGYPERRELLLADKPLLDQLFREQQPRISELTFAGLYLFRMAHRYRVSRLGDAVVITGNGYDGAPYFLPPLGGDRREAARRLLTDGWELYGGDEEVALLAGEPNLVIREERNSFDYLYRKSDLAELPGNRYHKKRNRIAYFTNRHDCSVEEYRESHRSGALLLLDRWLGVHDRLGNGSLGAEALATAEGLALSQRLGLEGVVLLVGGEIRGFTLGERLNGTTALCHFQKADPFLDGIYQLLDREFNRRLFTDCAFVNREQDLGEPNLRKSKLSYHPVELVKKFRIRSR